jgi:GNAT superfamily N-acetyltransferase
MTVASHPLHFRVATTEDVSHIVALVEMAYRGDEARQGWTTEADLIGGQRTDHDAVASALAQPDVVIVLGEVGPELFSCAQLTRRLHAVEFGMFAVRPQAQAAGLGGATLAEAEAVARQRWAATTMEMLVINLRPELIAWYGRRGYQPTGHTRPFPYGNPRYGLPRRDDLEFVVLAKALGVAAPASPNAAPPASPRI